MDNTINDGGSAFPFAAEYGHPSNCEGMTLRDYFAGKVIQGWLASLSNKDLHTALIKTACDERMPIPLYLARTAYEQADAMLKAREAK